MRKVFLILVVMFALMGCGTEDSDNAGGDDNTPTVTEDTVEDSETTTTVNTIGEVIVESQIDGVFKGWSGNTVVNLTNGQIWKQAEPYYHYHYSYRAKVIIYKTESGKYKMVVGDLKAVLVVRIE